MVPVVLRPYFGEILYSWLARTAAVYGVDHSDLLGFPATPWDLLAAPAPETLRRLAEFTRMPETALADLTIAGTDLPQRWWSIRQITPDPFAPNMEYTYHPTITFCRLCCGTTSSQMAMSICDSSGWQRCLRSVPCIVYRWKISAISALLGVSLSLYGPTADFDSFVLNANDLSQVRRSSAGQRYPGDPNLNRVRSSSGTHSRTRGICGFRAHGLIQRLSCRWSKICLGYSREGRKETADYLFITLIVPSFTFPGGSTACLNHARGWEILMLETGLGCFPTLPPSSGQDRFASDSS